MFLYACEVSKSHDRIAEDMVQRAFIALTRQDYSKIKDRLLPWLMAVIRNTTFKEFRYLNRHLSYADCNPEEYTGAPLTKSPAELKIEQEHADASSGVLYKAIRKLPKRWRTVIRLHLRDMSAKDIARHMNITVNNLNFILFSARKRLKMLLKCRP